MKIWFDTEFIEDGRTIQPLSIGAIREDGATFYAEANWSYRDGASQWVKDNVFPHLLGKEAERSRKDIAASLVEFSGTKPEFWAYYCSYDWVMLCQIFGTMMDLPKHWPMFCNDVKQLCYSMGNPKLPEQLSTEHHALSDAIWTRDAYAFLKRVP